MPAGHPVEARSILGALRGSVEERMEVGVVEPGNDVGEPAMAEAEGVVVVTAAFDELADIPFQLGGGGG